MQLQCAPYAGISPQLMQVSLVQDWLGQLLNPGMCKTQAISWDKKHRPQMHVVSGRPTTASSSAARQPASRPMCKLVWQQSDKQQ